MNAQFIAIGIIFVGLYFLTKEKKLAVEKVRKHRQSFLWQKRHKLFVLKKQQNFQLENTLAVSAAVDHILFTVNLVFAENA